VVGSLIAGDRARIAMSTISTSSRISGTIRATATSGTNSGSSTGAIWPSTMKAYTTLNMRMPIMILAPSRLCH
jgi:hypothetical protein